jgi:heme oxygenase
MTFLAVADPAGQRGNALSPPEPPSILSRLRLETRGEHDAIEQVLDLIGSSLTREGYRHRLEQFYGFYAPLEQALRARCAPLDGRAGEATFAAWPVSMHLALVPRLNKTAHLRQDLGHLGVLTATLPLCRELPPLEGPAEVLGCLYVLEGATLGGRLITRHIGTTFGITPATGGIFFEGYGEDTGRMWQAMRHLLVSSVPDTQTENAIVANAIATFACLRRWCEPDEKQPEAHRHA